MIQCGHGCLRHNRVRAAMMVAITLVAACALVPDFGACDMDWEMPEIADDAGPTITIRAALCNFVNTHRIKHVPERA